MENTYQQFLAGRRGNSGPSLPTRKTNEDELNNFNAFIRSQPYYQEWFASKGLNPNKVKLSRGQQAELEQVLRRNGAPVQPGMHIDQAGNLNQKNRLVRNTAIAAGAAAGAYFGGPALYGALTKGGTGSALAGKAGATVAHGGYAGGSAAIPAAATTMTSNLLNYAPYFGAGLNFLGNYLNGKNEEGNLQDRYDFEAWQSQLGRDFTGGENQKNRDLTTGENQKDRMSMQNKLISEFLMGNLSGDTNEQLARSRMALDATQMDPYAHAKALNSANVKRSFGQGVDNKGFFSGKYDLSAVSPENLQATGNRFYDVMNEARSGPAGWDAKKQSERDKIMEFLRQYGGQV